ncbi:MAG: hypothetical protein ACREEY_17515, partial [Brevundimonas sp.]
MKLDLICCAEQSIVDVRSNKLSLVNIYDGIDLSHFPAKIGPLSTVMLFRRSAGESESFRGVVRFYIDDEKIFEGPYEADFQGALETRVIADLDRMIIPHSGLL